MFFQTNELGNFTSLKPRDIYPIKHLLEEGNFDFIDEFSIIVPEGSRMNVHKVRDIPDYHEELAEFFQDGSPIPESPELLFFYKVNISHNHTTFPNRENYWVEFRKVRNWLEVGDTLDNPYWIIYKGVTVKMHDLSRTARKELYGIMAELWKTRGFFNVYR